jgi:hypothetical protein
MTRRKLTVLILAGALVVAGISLVLLEKNETSGPQSPAAKAQDGDAVRPAEAAPAQIEQVPQRSTDVYMPPQTPAVGASPPPN